MLDGATLLRIQAGQVGVRVGIRRGCEGERDGGF